jgi:hypothetical protein
VVTVTSTVPEPAGLEHVTCVSLTTETPVAALAPKLTPVAPVSPEPVIVTLSPPLAFPLVGAMLVTCGTGGGGGPVYVNWSAALVADVPEALVAVMSTVPDPAGLAHVIWVSETTFTPVAALAPKLTPVAPVNPLPVIVTLSPPLAFPLVGATLVTCGTGGGGGPVYVN